MAEDIKLAFQRWKSINPLVEKIAGEVGVDPTLVHRVIRQESAYDPKAISKAGAQGLMQLMPGTAAELGVKDPFDPEQNIRGGVTYLKQMLDRYQGDTKKALMAYNAGPGNVDSGKAAGFRETKDYVQRVMPQQEQPAQGAEDIKAAFAKWKAEQAKAPAQPNTPKKLTTRQLASGGPAANLGTGAPAYTDLGSPLKVVLDNLPTLGGAIGGLIGGAGGSAFGLGFGGVPGAVGGAALGGSAGKAAQDLINLVRGDKPLPASMQESATEIAKSGAIEGATQAAGLGIGKGVAKVGKSLVKRAVKPTVDMLRKAPNVIDDVIDLNLGVSERGLARGEKLTSASANAADKAIADVYQSTGATVPSTQIAGSLQNTMGHIMQRAEQTPDINRLANFELDFLNNFPKNIPLPAVQALKRAEQKEAQRIYDAAAKGSFVPSIEPRLHADIASGAQNALEQLVPNLGTINAETQRRLVAQQAIKHALERQTSGVGGFVERHGLPVAFGMTTAAYDPLMSLPAMAALEVLTNPRVEAALGRGLVKGPAKLPFHDIFRTGKIRLSQEEEEPR